MFTGIITHLGLLKKLTSGGPARHAEQARLPRWHSGQGEAGGPARHAEQGEAGGLVVIEAPKSLYQRVKNSHSVAVDGICLTVIKKQAPNLLYFEVMPETVQKTHLSKIKIGSKMNLELPVKPDGEMGGHFVQGHVDGAGKIAQIKRWGNSWIFTIKTPKKLMPYIVDKGSIALNGISLTVIKAGKDYFTTGIIPYTWKHTMLSESKVGDMVNLETDVLAKYIVKLVKRMR